MHGWWWVPSSSLSPLSSFRLHRWDTYWTILEDWCAGPLTVAHISERGDFPDIVGGGGVVQRRPGEVILEVQTWWGSFSLDHLEGSGDILLQVVLKWSSTSRDIDTSLRNMAALLPLGELWRLLHQSVISPAWGTGVWDQASREMLSPCYSLGSQFWAGCHSLQFKILRECKWDQSCVYKERNKLFDQTEKVLCCESYEFQFFN